MREDLRSVAATVDQRGGWDFSCVRARRDPVPWDYAEVVRRFLDPSRRVLDIGTGGGEQFLTMAPAFGAAVGIDIDPAMIDVARANAAARGIEHVAFDVMPADALSFPDASFDIVLARHAPISVPEVARVLRSNGVCITQQVGGRNTQNVFAAFGWGSNGEFWAAQHRDRGLSPQDRRSLQEAFEQHGFRTVAWGEYDVGYTFLDLASFIFWLEAVPLPEVFDVERHEPALRAFLDRHRTEAGIVTNEHRELLIVRNNAAGQGCSAGRELQTPPASVGGRDA